MKLAGGLQLYGSSKTFYLQNNKNISEDHEFFLVGFMATEMGGESKHQQTNKVGNRPLSIS